METTTAQTIARHVRRLRSQRGWTQAELGKKAHCAQTAVSQLEIGIKCPTVDTVERIAKAFSLPTWALSLPVDDLTTLDPKALDTVVHYYVTLPKQSQQEIERVVAAERRYNAAA